MWSDSAPVTGPITLRELADIDVGRLRGVGERKREALSAFEIENVLDLVTTYPRRWVDRTNEARIEDWSPDPRGARAGHRAIGRPSACSATGVKMVDRQCR